MTLTEKLFALASFNKSMSSPVGRKFWSCRVCRNLTISPISQSLRDLRKVGDHPPASSPLSQISATLASLFKAKLKRTGNLAHKASSPHQTSFQKLILLPSPRTKTEFWKNLGHSFLISFHKLVPYPPLRLRVCHALSLYT